MFGVAHDTPSVLRDSVFWNNETGVNLPYTQQTIVSGLTVLHDGSENPLNGVTGNTATRDIIYEDLRVSGYKWGIEVARSGFAIFNGCWFTNIHNIVVHPGLTNGRRVEINGPIQFGRLPNRPVGSGPDYDVYMRFDASAVEGSISHLFRENTVILNYGIFDNQRAYYNAQLPDAVPFSSPAVFVPISYVGLTNQQLLHQVGVVLGGELAPTNGIYYPSVGGVVAPPAS